MSDQTMEQGADEIAVLLAERQRVQGWLERLDRSSGSAPESVRVRVRADYEARLADVVGRLGGYSAALSESLEDVRSRQADFERQRAQVEEALAEAELRHAVGEYTDGQWDEIAREHGSQLDTLSAEIGQLSDEAARLVEVLRQVAPVELEAQQPGEPTSQADVAAESAGVPEDVLEVEVIEVEEVALSPEAGEEEGSLYEPTAGPATEPIRVVPVEAPRFTPKPGMEPKPRERPTPRTLRFPVPPAPPEAPATSPIDEMTFLKSVTLEAGTPARERGSEGRGLRGARGGTSAAKTLKCTECGAMNRPTEWYCERCGAELAAV